MIVVTLNENNRNLLTKPQAENALSVMCGEGNEGIVCRRILHIPTVT